MEYGAYFRTRPATGTMSATMMQAHFRRLAPNYNALRTTDSDPVEYIRDALLDHRSIRCADVGCGSGRYDLLLLRALPQLNLVCCDINRAMLDEAECYLARRGETRYSLRLADAAAFAATDGEFDCIVSFNAIHHFDPVPFLEHAAESLAPGGPVFVYTRLQPQNENTIWGRHFPSFCDRESRLYRYEDIERWTRQTAGIELRHIKEFNYRRRVSLRQLVGLARSRHYSTFEFYSNEELAMAIDRFSDCVRRQYADEDEIEWIDANVMIEFRSSP